ncbi:phosphoribosyltransferase [Pseudophaeobacter sp. 1A16562]|uniref:phosphoribosyltransferase n=1 Tax=Pseudophaeobacter sp. 1A16562 TaxID=3098143 RepID=UPI0034D5F9E0
MTLFKDRTDAGQALAAELSGKGYQDPVILALPRGGVPVAAEVARALNAPMDLIMVRKIGAPEQPELAVAAVVNGSEPKIVTNREIARSFGLAAADIKRMSQPRLEEIRRRRDVYLKGRKQVPLRGRTAIVVDDGIATGATVRASLRAVRARKPARLVLAVPVAPRDVAESLRDEVDELICLKMPFPFGSIGRFYSDFSQTSDGEVVRLLDAAAKAASAETP